MIYKDYYKKNIIQVTRHLILLMILNTIHIPRSVSTCTLGLDNVCFIHLSVFFFNQILEEMQRLAQETNHAKLIDIGTSYEYRKIYAIKVKTYKIFRID